MGRRSLLALMVAVAVLPVLVLVPLASSARLPSGAAAAIGRYSTGLVRTATKTLGKLLKEEGRDMAQELFKDLLIASSDKAKKSDEEEHSASTAGLFIFNLSVGTSSPQSIPGILDISSQLVWWQCAPCSNGDCRLPAPTFLPKSSATFAPLPCGGQTCKQVLNETCPGDDDTCGYIASYGDTNTTGYLATETFTFRTARVPGLVFGCSFASAGDYSGVFGFSKGPLSLVSQLQISWFSYFWASDDSDGSSQFGFGFDSATQTKNSRSTPLIPSVTYPDLYIVNLTAIRVNGEDLAGIPAGTFDLRPDGSGGVFLSTTTPATFLEEAAYDVVRKALAASIKAQPVNGSKLGLDLCYTTQSLKNTKPFPKLALVFDGVDAVMKLQRDNYFFSDNDTGLDCLTIVPFQGGSILGSLLQTGRNMTYDIAGAQLIFDAEAHTAAASSPHSLVMKILCLLAAWLLLF